MDGVPKLVPNSRLKTTLLAEINRTQTTDLHINYDEEFDALRLLVVSPSNHVIVAHYADDNVAILYRAEDFEVVGIQVEAFERTFVPKHDALRKVWRLSDTGIHLKDMGDMFVQIDIRKPQVAHEVAEATRTIIGETGDELIAAIG